MKNERTIKKTYRGCDYDLPKENNDPYSEEKVTLEFKWNWRAQMKSIILLLERGDSDGKKYAREELLELADKLDRYNFNKNLGKGTK
jgi:hypothetical protein|tara:strand:- start:342 stop:602 length:261 start_codon:yes stop_codon:yes gene_type:complete